MAWEKTGAKYLKTGDESGHLCSECDVPMTIDKTNVNKKGGTWYIECRCCGKKLATKEVGYTSHAPVYV